MSSYFSNFSLNKITDSIATAAHKTQDTLTNAIANVNLNDPQTKLSIKSRTRYLQESLGAVDEISKLPPQYESLEKKSDALEKCCRRMLLVTKTFEVEGYDYPPNLTESISDWWSMGKESWFGSSSKNGNKEAKTDSNDSEVSETFMPRSFAQALAKAAYDSSTIFPKLQEGKTNESQANETDEEIDEEFEDINDIQKMFETLSKCYKNLDEGKHEMDTSIGKEFNAKLEKLINEDFKKVHELRRKVEDSRLKFDTVLYEIKLKQKKTKEAEEKIQGATKNETPQSEEIISKDSADLSKEKDASETENSEGIEIGSNPKIESSGKKETEEAKPLSEDQKLLEQLEDEFVSNTSAAVEVMGEITDCTELLSLMKLLQTYQLVYFRQCVQELESSLKSLTELENEQI